LAAGGAAVGGALYALSQLRGESQVGSEPWGALAWGGKFRSGVGTLERKRRVGIWCGAFLSFLRF